MFAIGGTGPDVKLNYLAQANRQGLEPNCVDRALNDIGRMADLEHFDRRGEAVTILASYLDYRMPVPKMSSEVN